MSPHLALLLALAANCSTPVDAHVVARRHASAGEITPSVVPAVPVAHSATDLAGPRTTARIRAEDDTNGLHVVVSLAHRTLWVLKGTDTLRAARVGVGMDSTLSYEGRVWKFETPRGGRRVIAKQADPVWSPPEWHYVEMAKARHLRLVQLPAHGPYMLPDSSAIVVRQGDVGLLRAGLFRPFAEGEEIIQDSTLYVPPLGTRQRKVAGELGRYRLDLGDGYLMHGTPYTESIGEPSSHGCIRLGDSDIAWLYAHVPVGTPVIIR